MPRKEEPSWFAGGKLAKVDRITRIEMADPLTPLNALNSGEVDYVQNINSDLMPLGELIASMTAKHGIASMVSRAPSAFLLSVTRRRPLSAPAGGRPGSRARRTA